MIKIYNAAYKKCNVLKGKYMKKILFGIALILFGFYCTYISEIAHWGIVTIAGIIFSVAGILVSVFAVLGEDKN